MAQRYDSRHTGLDAYVLASKTFADSPWLHYGMWEPGERVVMPNVRRAQERYVEHLLALLPPAPASVLDIGGGTGELAKLMVKKGYQIELITPSPVQAEAARGKLAPEIVPPVFFRGFRHGQAFRRLPVLGELPVYSARQIAAAHGGLAGTGRTCRHHRQFPAATISPAGWRRDTGTRSPISMLLPKRQVLPW